MNHYWHIYRREQIHPERTGNAVLTLTIPVEFSPRITGLVFRGIDPGRQVALTQLFDSLSLLRHPFGIMFEGIDFEEARQFARWLGTSVPVAENSDWFDIHWRNKRAIASAQKVFLSDNRLPANCDPLTYCLTRGLTHLLLGLTLSNPIPTSIPKNPAVEPNILVVEDEEQQMGMFQIILQSIGFEKILSARNGVEALPLLNSHGNDIDLILLNWFMPKMDGITLLRLLAQKYPHPVGILMESGYSDERHMREFFSAGSDLVIPIDYVPKPFVFDEFKLGVRIAMEIIGKLKRRFV